jgi:hypothetical protein
MKRFADYTLGVLIVLAHLALISWRDRHSDALE